MGAGDGKVFLITGGSSKLGATIASAAAASGYSVAIGYHRNAEAAERTSAGLRAAGAKAAAFGADIADPSAVTGLFEKVEAALGPVDVLVNGAGLTGGRSDIADLSPEALATVINVNFVGTFNAMQIAFRRMKRGGSIVNISSMAATTGGFQLAHYAAAKAAVETLTKSATWEAARLGLRINAVAPGTISGGHASAEESARFAKSTPLGRAGNAEEVAAAVLWLASPEASYVTGTVLPVSGGR